MRILVVDDEADLLDAVARGLRREGYAVDTADGGAEAIEKATFIPYDLICLDLTMPGIDGLEVCSTLRADPPGEVPPRILMLTARDTVEDRIRGLDVGADDYLVKPFAPSELIARLRAIVRRREGRSAGATVVGSLVCDWNTGRVQVNDRDLSLRPREWAALRVLASRPGQVVDRELLAAEVFPQDEAPSLNALEIHVGRLRRKLQPDGPAVTNIRGRGYRLDP